MLPQAVTWRCVSNWPPSLGRCYLPIFSFMLTVVGRESTSVKLSLFLLLLCGSVPQLPEGKVPQLWGVRTPNSQEARFPNSGGVRPPISQEARFPSSGR